MMQTATLWLKHLKLMLLILLPVLTAFDSQSQIVPLSNGFAHNDYWHKRPLYDALENGYMHVEADVYLRRSKLVVAHLLPFFRKKRTLDLLYLAPLWHRLHQDSLSSSNYPITLMIDIKSRANSTYRALQAMLEPYRSILTSYENGVIVRRQVTIVLTGHKPDALLRAQCCRWAFMDEDLRKAGEDTTAQQVYVTASCKYAHLLSWQGEGAMPSAEKERLCDHVKAAHRHGQKVRLWASPENVVVWRELLDCGVDLINTDHLVALKNFLLRDGSGLAQAGQTVGQGFGDN